MTDTEQTQLPTAVYGTMREGYGNSRAWKGLGFSMYDGEATIKGYRLVSNGSFPYALPSADDTIVCGIVYPTPGRYDAMLASTDALEGYPVHYDRVQVVATTPKGDIFAWLYTPTDPEDYKDYEIVLGNDWRNARRLMHGVTEWWEA